MKKRPWQRRFPPTREGWWFLATTLLVGMAAVNAGVNLLFLVFGMMLALIVASGVMSELCLRDLVVTRRPPSTVHAGAPFLMGVAVRNGKRQLPTFSLEVEDLLADRPVERRCYYLKLPAGRAQETAYKHMLGRRGRHQFTGFRISTRFPFGFIRKSREIDAPAELVVYPALIPVPESVIRAGLAELGRRQDPSRSRSGDFHGLREFRSGDDPRDIHWRTSAKRGRAFVRECEEETGMTVVVLLEGERAVPGPEGDAAFEDAVSLAASVAVALLRKGLNVGLHAADIGLPPASGGMQATQILRALALVERADAERTPAPIPPGAAIVRVTPGALLPRFEPAVRGGSVRRTA